MKVLVVAPHADDEVLGCGGVLLRRATEGCKTAWLLASSMKPGSIWSAAQVAEREVALQKVCLGLGISPARFFRLDHLPAHLEKVSRNDLVGEISSVFERYEPDELYLPCPGDAHNDHRIVFEASAAAAKWFRRPSIRRILCYETLSETEASFAGNSTFRPDVFLNISGHLDKKIELMKHYASEMASFPFPRSVEAIRALAHFRGAQSGFSAAEAFQLLRERC